MKIMLNHHCDDHGRSDIEAEVCLCESCMAERIEVAEEKAKNEGYDKGYEDGYEDGKEAGHKEGYEEGFARAQSENNN